MTRALGLAVVAGGLVLGVLALALAVDVGRVERAYAVDDARFESRPLAGGYWEPRGRVPLRLAERLGGLSDDLAHRRAVEAFWRSGPRRPPAQRKRLAGESARAQRLLAQLEPVAPTPEREGQILLLRGVLALVEAPAQGDRRALVLAAAESFRRAILADPALDDAKFALEALLRNTSHGAGPGQGEGSGGTHREGEPTGASLSRPGEGY